MSETGEIVCESCKTAKSRLGISYGKTEEVCPGCGRRGLIYYKREGRFIDNHCSMCHKWFDEEYPWNPYK
jgi:hypothetical protein